MDGLKTPLYETHKKYGGKIVPFGGYLLPVQYPAGVIEEHMAVRTKAGLFDVSHMGEIMLTGSDALKNLQTILTNDFTNMSDGQARYSPMCNENGGTVDDLIVYKYKKDSYLIVVNAANKDKDFAWMKAHEFGDACYTDISQQVAQLALQGPKAKDILKKVIQESDIPEKYYWANFDCEIRGMKCIISQTGYTGEDGYEIYLAADQAEALWELLMEVGAEEGLIPCGLGARDTLRLEAGMPLYGHEMDDAVSPLETALGFAVKFDKLENFVGKEAMMAKKPYNKTRVGLKVTGRGIVREHLALYVGDRQIGMTTSGTHCPYLKTAVAMALVDSKFAALGTAVEADVRGRRVACEIVKLPFYKKTMK